MATVKKKATFQLEKGKKSCDKPWRLTCSEWKRAQRYEDYWDAMDDIGPGTAFPDDLFYDNHEDISIVMEVCFEKEGR